jgi:hypothetical protein
MWQYFKREQGVVGWPWGPLIRWWNPLGQARIISIFDESLASLQTRGGTLARFQTVLVVQQPAI